MERDQESAQYSNISSVKNSWVIDSHDQTLTLATANGSKTVETLLNEANTALRAISISSGYAYEIFQIVVPTSNGTVAQTAMEVCNSYKLITGLSTYNLRAYRVSVSSNLMMSNTLYLPDKELYTTTINLTNGNVSPVTDYSTRKPSNGTTLYIRYNIWKKV